MTTLVDPLALAPAPAPNAVVVAVGDEAIVVDEDRGHLHLLNPSGALVWSLLDGRSSVDDICVDLADAFGSAVETVRGDVGALVQRLLDDAVLVADGYVRPPLPDELGVCDCGTPHGPDDVDVIEIPGNP